MRPIAEALLAAMTIDALFMGREYPAPGA
jgi:hypothetical protein